MNDRKIIILTPAECSNEELKSFHELVISGNQVEHDGLSDRISAASLLAFAYVNNELAGVASIKNQKRSYITGIFLKAKIPRLAENYQYEIGYAVTHENFRRQGISRELITALVATKPDVKLYATTKNDDMRNLLDKAGFTKAGNSYLNANEEVLDLFISA